MCTRYAWVEKSKVKNAPARLRLTCAGWVAALLPALAGGPPLRVGKPLPDSPGGDPKPTCPRAWGPRASPPPERRANSLRSQMAHLIGRLPYQGAALDRGSARWPNPQNAPNSLRSQRGAFRLPPVVTRPLARVTRAWHGLGYGRRLVHPVFPWLGHSVSGPAGPIRQAVKVSTPFPVNRLSRPVCLPSCVGHTDQ